MFWKRYCFCVNWQWPLVWRKDAEKSKADALKWQRSCHEKELADERAAIAKLIPRIVKVGARGMGGRDIYAINVAIDASMFRDMWSNSEQRYFARYVAEHVEREVACAVFVRPDR